MFNNAGIGGGSFVLDSRADWERTFGVCWGGVYLGCRIFLPALIASQEAHVINTSSVNGFWARLGPGRPHTAHSSAKFAVKGFTEALRIDLRLHGPRVKVSLVMPDHVGTSIVENTMRVLYDRGIEETTGEELAPMRRELARAGVDALTLSDEQLRRAQVVRGRLP